MRDIFLALGCALLVASPAGARTLILTHPETQFDVHSDAGQKTAALLQSYEFDRKIVLLTRASGAELTFPLEALQNSNAQVVVSNLGEFDWPDTDEDVVVGGGYLNVCLKNTMNELIFSGSPHLKITVDMSATYTGNIFPSAVFDQYAVASLHHFESLSGEGLARRLITNHARMLNIELMERQSRLLRNNPGMKIASYRIAVTLHGEPLWTIDLDGSAAGAAKSIVLDFD